MLYYLSKRVSFALRWSQETSSRSKRMKLRNAIPQKRQQDVAASKSRSPQTNFQLEGFWLHLARGAWISFILVQLLVIILTLIATHGENYSICPFIVSCAVTPATAQALHHLSIAPSSYVTYNLVLALLQSLVFLSIGSFIFWRKSSEPVALVASFFFVSIGLSPFFPPTPPSTYPPEVVFSNIYGLRVFSSSQRQQAKWLLFGFGGVFVLIILYDLIGSLVPGLGAPDSLYQLANGTLTFVIFLFVPLSVAIAILRSRLWEIDVIIHRTLIYGMLTVVLTGVYIGLIISLQALLRGI